MNSKWSTIYLFITTHTFPVGYEQVKAVLQETFFGGEQIDKSSFAHTVLRGNGAGERNMFLRMPPDRGGEMRAR